MQLCLSPRCFSTMAPRAFCELCAGLGVAPSVLVQDGHWLNGASFGEELQRFVALAADNGLEVRLATVPNSIESLVQNPTVLQTLRNNGIRFVRPGYQKRIGFDARSLALMARRHAVHATKLAQQFDLIFLFHIHHGMYPHNATTAYHMVEDMNPAHVRVMLDPGENLYEGTEDLFYQCDLLNEFVGAVGLRDMAVVRQGDRSNERKGWERKAVPGYEGLINWTEVAGALKSIGFDGPCEIAPFYDPDDLKALVQKLKKEVKYYRQVFA